MSSSNFDKLARQLEWQLADTPKKDRQAANITSAATAQLLGLDQNVEILFGRVVDCIPYVGCYKVLPERGLCTITCQYLTPAPNGVLGAKGVSSIPPGAHVWFIYHPKMHIGLIIGIASYFMSDATAALSDYIYQGSRSGFHSDIAHSYPLTLNTRGIGDWSAGKPFDNTTAGEWGAITETGLRVLLDSFMVQLGVGESCGLFAYLWDNLCRLAGTNLQIRANAFEREALDDESEHYDVENIYVYPWETMGLGSKDSSSPIQTYDAQAAQIDSPWYSALEPQNDDQNAIPRLRKIQGYLGQGGKRLLSAPITSGISQLSNPVQQASLFEEHISLRGGYSLRSASDIVIARRPLIPVITPAARPETSTADNSQNYKASGAYGDGTEHKVTGDIPVQGDVEKPFARMASIQDIQSYIFNWENVHPFHYHTNDWNLSEESAAPLASAIGTPDFNALANHSQMYLDDASTSQLKIDHRYGDVNFTLSSSYFSLLKDGGVAIGDGFGSEIRMSGGHIHITAPGDIWLKSGRNTVNWSGRDSIIRANNCFDASTSVGDIRMKSEAHMWMCAGNNGSVGALLLESRGSGQDYQFDAPDHFAEDALAGGIILRTESGNIVNWGQNIYMRTGGGDVNAGNIVLDASRGDGVIITNSGGIANFVKPAGGGMVINAFYDDAGSGVTVNAVQTFTAQETVLDGNLRVNGYADINGNLFTDKTIYVNNGHIVTSDAEEYNGLVNVLGDDALTWRFAEMTADIENLIDETDTYYSDALYTARYADNRAGNDLVMEIGKFSFRTSKNQCKTLSEDGTLQFRLFEDRWQQMSNNGMLQWLEPNVTSQGIETKPYPGYDVFAHGEAFVKMPQTMFDVASGTALDRGEDGGPYVDPKLGVPELSSLNSYTILG